VLCSTRGLRVLQAFEAIASDERQARVEACVAVELEQDLQDAGRRAPPAPEATS